MKKNRGSRLSEEDYFSSLQLFVPTLSDLSSRPYDEGWAEADRALRARHSQMIEDYKYHSEIEKNPTRVALDPLTYEEIDIPVEVKEGFNPHQRYPSSFIHDMERDPRQYRYKPSKFLEDEEKYIEQKIESKRITDYVNKLNDALPADLKQAYNPLMSQLLKKKMNLDDELRKGYKVAKHPFQISKDELKKRQDYKNIVPQYIDVPELLEKMGID